MSTSVIRDSVVDGAVSRISGASEVEFAKCDCCGLTEECTPSYIDLIRARYGGKWLCGLCAEAVKDEISRCEKKAIGPEEALLLHCTFCNKIRAALPPQDPARDLIRALTHVLRRQTDSPKSRNKSQLMRSVSDMQ